MSRGAQLDDRLARIRLLVVDVDGVLTDGTLYYGAGGEQLKAFHVRDGLGMRLLLSAGVQVAVITARRGEPLARRMADLGVTHVASGRDDKATALDELFAALDVAPAEVAFVGDDVLDLPAMRRAGVAVAVADAHPLVRNQAHWVTETRGGAGAVREVADRILAAQGTLAAACDALSERHRKGASYRVVIPSRYGSVRLPGKPLRPIAGRPMIEHVWRRACSSRATEVLVATDDARIAEVVEGFGGRAVMTSPDHSSGTDRLAQVVDTLGWPGDAIVVNVQGDEPGIEPALIDTAAEALVANPSAQIATLATPIQTAAELFDPNAVKVVIDDQQMATYFSRAPIPWARDAFGGGSSRPDQLPANITFLRHVGMYAYRAGVLRRLAAAPPRPAERAESLEQLRALAMGIRIHITVVDRAPLPGVDTEEDLALLERALATA